MAGNEAAGSADDQAKQVVNTIPSYESETEREVAQVFAEMLHVKWVSPTDDVFTLGGDSFEAVRIGLELEYRFNLEFPAEMLESTWRVCDLAAWIDAHRGSSALQRAAPA
jgi:acyl carrier protein